MTEHVIATSGWRGAQRLLSSIWLKVALAAGVICALVAMNRVDLQVFRVLAVNWSWVVAALGLMAPPYFIVSYRFLIVLRNQHIDANLRQAIRWTMIGSFFDLAMPSNSGGDFVKAGYVIRHAATGARTRAVMAIAFDRILGLIGLFLLAGIACLAGWSLVSPMGGSTRLALFLVAVCAGSLALVRIVGSRTLSRSERFRNAIEKLPIGDRILQLVACFNSLREHPLQLVLALGLSVLNHVFWCTAILCITIAFGGRPGLLQAFIFFPLAVFGNVFGFAGGFGVGTVAFDWIFAHALDIQIGAAVGLTFQTLGSLSRLAGLPFYLAASKTAAGRKEGARA